MKARCLGYLLVVLVLGLIGLALHALYERGQLGGKPALQSCLFVAIWRDEPVNVQAALRRGANPNEPSVQLTRPTPLIDASRLGHFEIVKVLLANGADPNKTDKTGHAALYYTLSSEDLGGPKDHVSDRIVSMLLEHGANPSANDVGKALSYLPPNDLRRIAFQAAIKEVGKAVEKGEDTTTGGQSAR
jgi:ankyrin repeat protein